MNTIMRRKGGALAIVIAVIMILQTCFIPKEAVFAATNTGAAQTQTKYNITIYCDGILKTDATETTKTLSQSISSNTSWTIQQKKLDNQVTSKNFTKNGITYTYTGVWEDQNGNTVNMPMSFKGKDLTGDVDLHIHPVYTKTGTEHLDFRYIDNVSTGSGSWYNKDSVSGYSHTFKTPEAQDHYRFVKWTVDEPADSVFAGNTDYNGGDTYVVTKEMLSTIGAGNTKEVRAYAYWQPSVTVNWHDMNGDIIETQESFDGGIGAYDYKTENKSVDNEAGETVEFTFEGWTDADGKLVDTDANYTLPAVTTDRTDQKVIDLYAKYTTTKTVSIVWDDSDDKDGIRPESMDVELVVNGETEETVTLDENNDWTYTFEGLDAYDNGNVVTYQAAQKVTPEGYEMTSEHHTALTAEFTNTHKIKANTVTGALTALIGGNGTATGSEADTATAAADKQKNELTADAAGATAIEDEATPMAAPQAENDTGSWALINLVLMAGTILLSLALMALYFTRRNREDDDEEEKVNRKLMGRLLGAAAAVLAVIVFIFTEDMTMPMVLVDKWTMVMALIFAADVVIAGASKKTMDDEDHENGHNNTEVTI